MSLDYYIEEWWDNFLDFIHWDDIKHGFYVGTQKVGDAINEAYEAAREKARQADFKMRCQKLSRTLHSKKQAIHNRQSLLNKTLEELEQILVSLNEEIKAIDNDAKYQGFKATIIAKRDEIEHEYHIKVQEMRAFLKNQEAEVERLETESNSLGASELDFNHVNALQKSADEIKLSNNVKVSDERKELLDLTKCVEELNKSINSITKALEELRNCGDEIYQRFSNRLLEKIESIDPLDIKSIKEAAEGINEILQEAEDYLLLRLADKNSLASEEALQTAIQSIKEAKTEFRKYELTEYEHEFMETRDEISNLLSEFEDVQSEEVNSEIMAILEELAYLDKEYKDHANYQKILQIRQRLVELQSKNEDYNEKYNEFHEYRDLVNEKILMSETMEQVDLEFNYHLYDEQMEQLEKVDREVTKAIKKQRYQMAVKNAKERLQKLGYQELVKERGGDTSDNKAENHYVKMVFIDKNNPWVVTVATILENGDIAYETKPAVYQIGGKYYYVKDSEELRRVLKETCNRNHGINETNYDTTAPEKELDYYVLNAATSAELNDELNIVSFDGTGTASISRTSEMEVNISSEVSVSHSEGTQRVRAIKSDGDSNK